MPTVTGHLGPGILVCLVLNLRACQLPVLMWPLATSRPLSSACPGQQTPQLYHLTAPPNPAAPVLRVPGQTSLEFKASIIYHILPELSQSPKDLPAPQPGFPPDASIQPHPCPAFHPSQEDQASTGVNFLQKQGSLSLNPRHSPTLPVTGPVPAKDGDFLSPPPQWHNFHFVSDRWKQIQVLPASPLTYRSQPWRLALSCVFPGII